MAKPVGNPGRGQMRLSRQVLPVLGFYDHENGTLDGFDFRKPLMNFFQQLGDLLEHLFGLPDRRIELIGSCVVTFDAGDLAIEISEKFFKAWGRQRHVEI
jgi:hypothetical protein